MKLHYVAVFVVLLLVSAVKAQDINPRPLTMEEYEKSKKFDVKDLDKDTYLKFDNVYVLDRYEMKKPYFVTGDDGLKKRIDLYKLIAKAGMQELGLMVFYTNEKGMVYKVLVPNFTADAKVWEKYFEDIHAINKEEANFILKLSYILSKELSFQQYKSLNQGKDLSKESATYGNDICFPGDQMITLSDGTKKELRFIKSGDMIAAMDPITNRSVSIKVKSLAAHESKKYALIQLILIRAIKLNDEIVLSTRTVEATPNHPMLTTVGTKEIGQVSIGDQILCFNAAMKSYERYEVFETSEFAGAAQPVYNIVAEEGETFIVNDVMVKQK